MIYYNENDSQMAAWLRELMAAGAIPGGDVDERSIVEVQAGDLKGYRQCHFFAGIGGWAYALALAHWPEDEEVWTGSCPCQPFSGAGKNEGLLDERHLWPAFRRLIAERRPATVFGEQVASLAGRQWFSGVRTDLEGMGHAVGCADLCAASVRSPQRRQRLFWVADSNRNRRPARRRDRRGSGRDAEHRGSASGVGDAEGLDRGSELESAKPSGDGRSRPTGAGASDGMGDSEGAGHAGSEHGGTSGAQEGSGPRLLRVSGSGQAGGVGDTLREGLPPSEREELRRKGRRKQGRAVEQSGHGSGVAHSALPESERLGQLAEHLPGPPGWDDYEWVICRDPAGGPPKARRVEAGTFPLDFGLPGRVGLLRGYGNAIVPELAAIFIEAYREARA